MESELKTKPKVAVLDKINEVRVPAGELGAVVELIVRNKRGEITDRQVMLSKSFVKQFLQFLWLHCLYLPQGSGQWQYFVKDVDGNLQNMGCSYYDWNCNGPINDATYGIMVGTGTTAPTINDYQMETKIAHGVGAGQMQYSATSFGAPTEDGTTSHFTVTRDFANNSGGSITVREIGLINQFRDWGNAIRYFLTIRDAVNITVPDGETLTVNYRIQATV